MGCGCKEKKVIVPAQQPSRITFHEGDAKPPHPSPLVSAEEAKNIVEKLNQIQR